MRPIQLQAVGEGCAGRGRLPGPGGPLGPPGPPGLPFKHSARSCRALFNFASTSHAASVAALQAFVNPGGTPNPHSRIAIARYQLCCASRSTTRACSRSQPPALPGRSIGPPGSGCSGLIGIEEGGGAGSGRGGVLSQSGTSMGSPGNGQMVRMGGLNPTPHAMHRTPMPADRPVGSRNLSGRA
jgi:hypothetical protein